MATASGAPDLRSGVLVIDKPAGPTSHDVVAIVRRVLGGARTGHTGTLDPAATGVLPLVVGRATRLAQFLTATDKEYLARVRLGAATDTYDATGQVTFEAPPDSCGVDPGQLAAALAVFRGRFSQVPPPYSAKKTGGVRAYAQARRGEAVALKAVEVEVFELELVTLDGPDVTLRLVCSPGFYVRSLAHDLGARLGLGGHLAALRRTRSGSFTIEAAVALDDVGREGRAIERRLLPVDGLLLHLPAVRLTGEGMRRAASGRDLGPESVETTGVAPGPVIRLVGPDGALVGLGHPTSGGVLHPAVVLV